MLSTETLILPGGKGEKKNSREQLVMEKKKKKKGELINQWQAWR